MTTLEVEKSLKDNYKASDKVTTSFLKLVQECRDRRHIFPGNPKKDLKLNSKIIYYNSASCVYWNLGRRRKSTPEGRLEKSRQVYLKKEKQVRFTNLY